MPPVMGAASFVMAEFLGVPYSHIMLAAAIPAHLLLRRALRGHPLQRRAERAPRDSRRPSCRAFAACSATHGHLLAPVLAIFCLLLEGFTATYAAHRLDGGGHLRLAARPAGSGGSSRWASCSGGSRSPGWRGPPWPWRAWSRSSCDRGAAGRCASSCSRMGRPRCATAPSRRCRSRWRRPPPGIMIGIILQTGLAIRFTSFLVDFAGGKLFIALVITMIAAIILGTALPTTPAYIMLAALLIPALIKLGRAAPGRPHVRLLLRLPLRDHAARSAWRSTRRRPSAAAACGRRAGRP